MNASAYKLLGFVVWRAGRWYLRRSYGHLVPSRRALAAAGVGVAAVGVAGLVLAGRRD